MWHKEAFTLVHSTSITSFLSRLLDFFSVYPTRYPDLLCVLLTNVCAYETFRKASDNEVTRTWGDAALFCQLALSCRSYKTLSAGKQNAQVFHVNFSNKLVYSYSRILRRSRNQTARQ